MKRFRRALVVGLVAVGWEILLPSLSWAQANLENPAPNSFQSGIGIISGWKCTAAGNITASFDNGPQIPVVYGTIREDTRSACGDANNGFGLLWNWNLLGEGTHTVRALDNGVEFARATFTVTTLGVPFLSGASGEFTLQGFPQAGATVRLRWQESLQNFVIDDFIPPASSGGLLFSGVTSQGTSCSSSSNPSGSCHARFHMAATRDMLTPSLQVEEVRTSRLCANGAVYLFVARCGTTIIGDVRCSNLPVTSGHWEEDAQFPGGAFTRIVADCAGNTCSGTYNTSTTSASCVTGVLTWTATAMGESTSAIMEENTPPVLQPESRLHEEKGLQLEVNEEGVIHFTIPDVVE